MLVDQPVLLDGQYWKGETMGRAFKENRVSIYVSLFDVVHVIEEDEFIDMVRELILPQVGE